MERHHSVNQHSTLILDINMPLLAEKSLRPQEQFFDVVHESMHIRRSIQLFMWLQGDLQKLLPHDVLLVAHGDFANKNIRYNVISAAGEVNGVNLPHVDILDLVTGLFDRWCKHGRNAYSLETTSGVILNSFCQCLLHQSLRSMRSVMVQGMRDERAAVDVMYVAFRKSGHFDEPARHMFDVLLPHIDCATRRICNRAETEPKKEVKLPVLGELTAVTVRETEILHWVSNGKTNYEIGMILGISPFTVKNHLQRIFRKIDVSNRAHAVSKFEEMSRQQMQA
jgi:transcriptional regulator EpsA